MKIDAHVRSLKKIYQERKYIIPGYQRPYEWNKEQLMKAYENIKSCLFPEDGGPREEICMFGTIQLNEVSAGYFEIIDGQQRLTTFSLFLRALGELCGEDADPGFYPDNQIDEQFEKELKEADDEDSEYSDSIYRINYSYLKSLINKDEQINKEQLHEIINYLYNSICFVEVTTSFSNFGADVCSLEKTLKIFDVLNTTGLPLDMKDLFKIRYYDKVKTPGSVAKDVFSRINEAYSIISEFNEENGIYNIDENDLISSFKFWILGNEPNKPSANRMKIGAKEFFLDLFKKQATLPDSASLESFGAIAHTIHETQLIMLDLDSNKINLRRKCAKELLSWSGYWHLKNLFFVFVHAQKKGDLTQRVKTEYVENALALTELVWKVCSMFHATVEKILNEVFERIGTDVLWETVHSGTIDMEKITWTVRKNLINNNWRLNDGAFQRIIQGNIFDNSRKDLFLALSYIDDAEAENITAGELKRQLFYYTKWDWDIEHILSKDLYKDDDNLKYNLNLIGNLLFLEKSINRKLGVYTSTVNKKENARELDAVNKEKEYHKSTLWSVRRFCSVYKEELSLRPAPDLIAAILRRNNEKQKKLMDCYADVLQEFGK